MRSYAEILLRTRQELCTKATLEQHIPLREVREAYQDGGIEHVSQHIFRHSYRTTLDERPWAMRCGKPLQRLQQKPS